MENSKKKNVTHINSYSYNKTLENIRHYKHRKFVRIRMGIILASGIALIGISGLPSMSNTRETNEINNQYIDASERLTDLEEEKKQIAYQVGLLEDEEYIAKLARKELNLSKEHEILINLPEEKPVNDSDEENNLEENESD